MFEMLRSFKHKQANTVKLNCFAKLSILNYLFYMFALPSALQKCPIKFKSNKLVMSFLISLKQISLAARGVRTFNFIIFLKITCCLLQWNPRKVQLNLKWTNTTQMWSFNSVSTSATIAHWPKLSAPMVVYHSISGAIVRQIYNHIKWTMCITQYEKQSNRVMLFKCRENNCCFQLQPWVAMMKSSTEKHSMIKSLHLWHNLTTICQKMI